MAMLFGASAARRASTAAVAVAIALAVLPATPAAACLVGAVAGEGDRLVLDTAVADVTQVRLAGILAPRAPRQRPPAATAAGAPVEEALAAAEALAAIVAGRCLRLAPDQPPVDRHRRFLAWVYTDDGRLVQAELVRRGLVRVLPDGDDAALPSPLLALEAEARNAGRGLWADPAYRVRTPDDLADARGRVVLVEGRVRRATRVGPRVYLNFGDDWRSDFTVAVPARRLAAFAAAGRRPLQMGGQRVRVRGLVQEFNGPLIEIEAPAALEILDGPRQGAGRVTRLARGSAP